MRAFTFGILMSAVVVLQRPSAWQPVQLRSASALSDIDPLACRWDQADATFRRARGNRIEVVCDPPPADASVLQCDAPGFEPRDIKARALCASPQITLDEAGLGRATSTVTGDLNLVWFRWPDGPTPSLWAQRLASGVTTISFMAAPKSFVRFSLGEFSPRTATASDVVRSTPWPLDWRPGGELFVKHERGRVSPRAIDIVGPQSLTAELHDDWLSAPDLTAGTYTLRRIYAGGIRTRPVNAVIEIGRSTDAGLPLENVGGLRVTADSSACSAGDRLQLFAGGGPPRAASIAETRGCRWVLGGLAPGPYLINVTAVGPCAPELTQAAVVAAQEWTEVSLTAAAVVVCGQVSLLGEGLGNLSIAFDRDDGFTAPVAATTDANGRYVVALDQPGLYDVSLRTPLTTQSEQAAFSPGANEHNIKVKGGKVTVAFPDVTSRENAFLWIDAPTGKSSKHNARLPGSTELIVFGHGKFGVGGYAVDGPDKGTPVDRYQTIAITQEKPRARVEFRFAKWSQEIEIVDPSGRRLLNAEAVLAEGVVPLRGLVQTSTLHLPPNTPLVIQADEGRTCHILAAIPREQITIRQPTGSRVDFRFPKPGDDLRGLVSGGPGSNCPVALSHFSSQRIRMPGDGREVVRIALPAGLLTLDRDDRTYAVQVPGGAVVIK